MFTYRQAVRGVARHIADAIDQSVVALREGRVEHEPAMTDRMLGAIEQSLSGFHHKSIFWTAKTLTDRGPRSQESKFGADFMGVLNIRLPDFMVSKGFLAQAKLIRNGSAGNLDELKRQCEKMLGISPDSFVFLYAPDAVRVVPAVSVVGSSLDPQQLYRRSAQRFFEEHLQCFIGDRNINAPNADALDKLQNILQVRRTILIEAKAEK
jgi:hypothetical protein